MIKNRIVLDYSLDNSILPAIVLGMKTHPLLLSSFPLFVSSEVLIDNKARHVIYSNDDSHSVILGMGKTYGDALDSAEKTVRKMIRSGN